MPLLLFYFLEWGQEARIPTVLACGYRVNGFL
jgi:hypothetical protein